MIQQSRVVFKFMKIPLAGILFPLLLIYFKLPLRHKYSAKSILLFLALFFNVQAVFATAPILIFLNESDQNPNYCRYLAEILRAEGLNEFQEAPLDNLTNLCLTNFGVIILPQTHADDGSNLLTDQQKTVLRDYLASGTGSLIAFKPDTSFSDVFGLTYAGTRGDGTYICVLPSTPMGKSIVPDALKTHGLCDIYGLSDNGNSVALTADTAQTAIGYRQYAAGYALAFGFNLPESVVLMRQGNPAKANKDWNQDGNISAQDMFVDDWNGIQNNGINQADEQMHIFSRSIEHFMAGIQPLPRAWYFPNKLKSTVILTDDCEDSTVPDILSHLCDVTNIYPSATMTLYIKDLERLTANEVAQLQAAVLQPGGEISVHSDDTPNALSLTYSNMSRVINLYQTRLYNKFKLNINTIRNHWILWCGQDENFKSNYVAQADIESAFGIAMDCNYYHYDKAGKVGFYLGGPGSFTGSGLIMKFARTDGRLSSVYQSVTQLPDQQYQIVLTNKSNLYNPEALKSGFQSILDKSLNMEAYAYINLNFHTCRWVNNGRPGWTRDAGIFILNYAKAFNVPVCSAQYAWNFVDAKNSVVFTNLSYQNDELSFTLLPARPCNGFTFLVPWEIRDGNGQFISVNVDGSSLDFTNDIFKGKSYAFVTLDLDSSPHVVRAKYGEKSLFSDKSSLTTSNEKHLWELGSRFTSSHPGKVEAIRVFAPNNDNGNHHVRLWRNDNNECLYSQNIYYNGSNAWITTNLPAPIYLDTNVEYTVSVSTPYDQANNYPYLNALAKAGNNGSCLSWPANAGVYTALSGQRPTNHIGFSFMRDIFFRKISNKRYENLFYNKTPSAQCSDISAELGTRFYSSIPGKILGVRLFAVANETGNHIVRFWKNNNSPEQLIAPATFYVSGSNAWYNYTFSHPLSIDANTEYIVSISTLTNNNSGYNYAVIQQDLVNGGDNNSYLSYPANAGVFATTLGQMPTYSGNGQNYCRDIIFEPGESLFNINSAQVSNDHVPFQLGTVFSSKAAGNITGVRCFAANPQDSGNHVIRIWQKNNKSILTNSEAIGAFTYGKTKWGTYMYNKPIHIEANVEYVVSVSTGADGYYPYIPQGCYYAGNTDNFLSYPANAGVYTTDPKSMPEQVWGQMNYLRDVIFEPETH